MENDRDLAGDRDLRFLHADAFGLLLGDTLMNRQKGLNDSPKRMADVHQFDDLLTEWRADRPRKQQAVFLEHAANLVFDVTADTDEADAGDQDRADFLALALHRNHTMPTESDEFSEAPRAFLSLLLMRTESAACA